MLTVGRPGSRAMAPEARRACNGRIQWESGIRKGTWAGLPAGTSEIEPGGAGRAASPRHTAGRMRPAAGQTGRACGGSGRARGLAAGNARKRAASRPTHPSWSRAAAAVNGKIRRQSRSPIGAPRSAASSRIICVSLTSPAAGTDASSCVQRAPQPSVEPRGRVRQVPAMGGRLRLGSCDPSHARWPWRLRNPWKIHDVRMSFRAKACHGVPSRPWRAVAEPMSTHVLTASQAPCQCLRKPACER
jgi:hypothetical protein